jgi:Leucine Rich repeat
MPISEHLTDFAGFAVRDFDPKTGIQDTATTIYRIREEIDDTPAPKPSKGILGSLFGKSQAAPTAPASPWEALLADPKCGELKGIVYGSWFKEFDTEVDPEDVIVNLSMGAAALPNLEALFVGDITYEECEISWLHQTDVTPLFRAYPRLQHLAVRGSDGLKIGPAKHGALKSLIIQCGGLPKAVISQVLQSEFPALEHLELWLGEENYGADSSVGDLEPLLSGKLFPNLRHLGLRDSEITDEIASAIANAPILQRIETLDLSMGTLSDAGADALLASPAVKRLKKLDLHHHFLSSEKITKLQQLGLQIDVSEKKEADDYNGEIYRYVAVGE